MLVPIKGSVVPRVPRAARRRSRGSASEETVRRGTRRETDLPLNGVVSIRTIQENGGRIGKGRKGSKEKICHARGTSCCLILNIKHGGIVLGQHSRARES